MTDDVVRGNLTISWLWMLLGFVSGGAMGLFFHRDNWLGGYASLRRRMYRLAHISFFGLALMNLMFYVTAREAGLSGALVPWASRAFVGGALAMPVCCVLMAHAPKTRLLFAVPVSLLLAANLLTLASLGLR